MENRYKNTEKKLFKCKKKKTNCNRKSISSSLIKGHTVVFNGPHHSNSKCNCVILRKNREVRLKNTVENMNIYSVLLMRKVKQGEERKGKERINCNSIIITYGKSEKTFWRSSTTQRLSILQKKIKTFL